MKVLPLPASEEFVNRHELAKLMGVSVSTVDKMRRAGMPSVVWGARSRRFRPTTAMLWAQQFVLDSSSKQNGGHRFHGPATTPRSDLDAP